MSSRVRVFIATSLDGFIAGPDDDLSWLPQPSGDPPPDYGYNAFIAEVGALLMGRNTYDVVAGFEGAWPYGELPVLVATGRPLTGSPASVKAVSGDIHALVDQARAAAGEADVYLDGGNLIRQALDAELVDELIITVVPVILGGGASLFAGVGQRRQLVLESVERLEPLECGLVQLRYRAR